MQFMSINIPSLFHQEIQYWPGMMQLHYNFNTWEAEAGGSVWVQGQPELNNNEIGEMNVTSYHLEVRYVKFVFLKTEE